MPKKKKNLQNRDLSHLTDLPIQRITASMIRDYLSCPKLFYYRYILNLKLPYKPIALVFGGAVHDSIEKFFEGRDPIKYFKDNFKKDEIGLSIAEEDQACKKGLEPYEYIDLLFKENLEEGPRLLQAFMDGQKYLTKTEKICPTGRSEHPFKITYKNPMTGEVLPILVSGRFDRTTDTDQILEIKTSSKAYTQTKVDEAVQGFIYPQSYPQEFGRQVNEMIYIILIKGKKNPLQVLRTVRTESQQSQFFDQIIGILGKIKDGRFEEGDGFLHRYCDCHKYKEALQI